MNKRIACKVLKKAEAIGLLNYNSKKRLRKAWKIWIKYKLQ